MAHGLILEWTLLLYLFVIVLCSVQEVSSSGQSVDAGGVTMELNEDSVDDAEGKHFPQWHLF